MATQNQETRVSLPLNPVATTSANQTGASVDMQGFDECRFTFVIGTAAATATAACNVQTGASTTAFQDILGATATSTGGADDGLIDIIINNATGQRFLRPVITNATTANIEYGGIVAVQSQARDHGTATTATTTGDLLAAAVYITNPGT